jgi:hypothetical protein
VASSSSAEELDVFKYFFGTEISFDSRLKLRSEKNESRDCNQDQEKEMRRRDYSRTIRFFDGRLFSAHGVFPSSTMALGVFSWRRRTRGREMMEVCMSGFAEHRRGYFISSGSASGVMTGWRVLMRIPNDGGFSLDAKGFFIQTVFIVPE